MWKFLLLGGVALLAGFVLLASLQPDEFRVTRSAVIAAPPEAVFEQINTLANWNAWSPWARLDPAAKNTLEGPRSGVGSSFAWSGNNEVGEGRMTITHSEPSARVEMHLEFLKPFAGTSTTEFQLKPEGSGTLLTWSMSGPQNFPAKCMSLFMNCEKMCGDQFEQGFANRKKIVEPRTQG